MINYIYIAIAAIAGLFIGTFIAKVAFSGKREIRDLKTLIQQEKLRADAKVRKMMDDLNQSDGEFKLLINFISVFPQLMNSLSEADSLDKIAEILVIFYERILNAKQISFFVFNSTRGVLELKAKRGLPDQIPIGYSLRIGEGKIGWAAQKRMVMNEEDFETETYMVRQQIDKSTTVYFKVDLCAPLTYQDELLGIISIGNMIRRSKVDKVIVQMVGEIISPYIKNITEMHVAEPDVLETPAARKDAMSNKALFINNLDQRVEEARMMHGSLLTVAFIEVDSYSMYVQAHGINAGDVALATIGKLIISELPGAEKKSRFEESIFCVYYLNKPANEIYQSLNRIRDLIAKHNFSMENPPEEGYLSISIGIAFFPYNADSLDTLLSHASENAKSASEAGGNRIYPALEYAIQDKTDESEFDIDIINAFEE